MKGYALFRMPYAKECTQISGEVLEVASLAELGRQRGFVVAPFAPSDHEPILVIRPDMVEEGEVGGAWMESSFGRDGRLGSLDGRLGRDTGDGRCSRVGRCSMDGGSREDYHIDFANFHAHLMNGDFKKLVLSRSVELERTDDIAPQMLFQRACERYPRMFIGLVYTEQSDMWLTATPEILLAGKGREWQTVALAGTMPFEEGVRWSDKNIQEQRYVATYMTEQLEQFTDRFTEEGPATVHAGHLAHLRSDFHFTLPDPSAIGEVLQAFHPTPAVCGLPKEAAFRFILEYEHHDRSYYSGFMGPLFVHDRTDLFVTLRCMQLFPDGYRLFAGGGILKDSTEEQEWAETETKLDTMLNILYNK